MSNDFFKKYGVSQIKLSSYYKQMTTEDKIVYLASKWYDRDGSIARDVKLIDNATYEELYLMLDSSRILKYLFVAIYISVYDLGLPITTSEDIEDFVDKFVSLESLLDFVLWSAERAENG